MIAGLLASGCCSAVSGAVVDFESPALGSLTHQQNWSAGGGFASGGAFFENGFTDFGGFSIWDGFALSSEGDVTTAGFGNQYSSFAGGGSGGSGQFTVVFPGLAAPKILLPTGEHPLSLEITNTTYAALSMRDGDFFAKKFGGASGNDPDFLKLSILGRDDANLSTGSVDFYLADFRFADNAQDYIVNAWSLVDLSSLAETTRTLEFSFASSDVGAFGINTPTYAALDNLRTTIPEPCALALMISAVGGLMIRRPKL